ncbi:MAG: MBL fold metallo-hydrolase [Syntrophomonadaceae bacterium]|nr:MBL fold metallo-hydrolase [Syntrophomonadaceae bacterium]MDD3022900.1 MBL fold metallo-hydrolase [Syntrophomonadaceae bacterium]
MKIRWLGHASFLIETEEKRIITDPFDEKSGYPVFPQEVDIATVSHEHWDHNAVHVLKGNPMIIKGAGDFGLDKIRIKGISSFHDKNQGKNRGTNTIYKIISEGLNLLHLGDLGQILTREQIREIGKVDVLFIPVGGNYTIDAKDALAIVEQIKPGIIIPMHFKTAHVTINLAPVEAFVCQFERCVKKPYLELSKEGLGSQPLVMLLDYQY